MNSKTTPWFVKGDINGFFGLFTNSLTNIMTALGLLIVIGMPSDIVFKKIAPALVLAVGFGNLYMAWAAKKLADKNGQSEVTALPYGVSVPHYFIVSFAVIATTMSMLKGQDNPMSDEQILLTAWGVGMAWSFVQGLIMLAGAVVGPFLHKHLPKAALLGSLAGLAVTFIAMTPIANVFLNPIVGMTSLAILMIGWLANKKLPFNIPAGFLAIVVGAILGWSMGLMEFEALVSSTSSVGLSFPDMMFNSFINGFKYIAPFLPAAIPLGIYDFLESLDNVESAHTAGEHYNTAEMLVIPAALTILTAPIGNVFPMIIYIGHPGWKATGARIGYSLATGVGVILLGILGGLAIIGKAVPLVALVPILIYIATVIGKQAFGSVNKKYYPALIIGIMPFIASFMMLQIKTLLSGLGLSLSDVMGKTTVPLFGYLQFGAADILVSMMLITITIFVIARNFKKATIYCLISAVLAYFGFIHAEAFSFKLYIPDLASHTFWGYITMAIMFIIADRYQSDTNVEGADE